LYDRPPKASIAGKAGERAMAEQGVIKWYTDEKGYGFIAREQGLDIFVHHTGIVGGGIGTLTEGDQVSFDVVEGPKGLQARNVVKIA
jgi:CspA family cold shock protein